MATYQYEPSRMEVLLTYILGNTLLDKYYSSFVESLDLHEDDHVLDFGCGCGIIAQKMAKKVTKGSFTYIDVSKRWLNVSSRRLKSYKNARGLLINEFPSQTGVGKFSKIVVHYTLHDFPKKFLKIILHQLVENLDTEGILILREPIDEKHGLPLYEIYRVIEKIKEISASYSVQRHRLIGDYAEIQCKFRT